jgi:ABC-type branched-subunit amino acid transport system substrate-binding protein
MPAGPPAWHGLVKIGLVLPFHGPNSSAAMATHVAVRERLIAANARGGIAGWRLELVSLDDEGDPTIAAQRARELTRDPRLVAVLAPPASGVTEPLRQAGLRLIALDDPASAPTAVDRLLADVADAAAGGSVERATLRRAP